MDITGYKKKRENGEVELRPSGNGNLHVFVSQFSPVDGSRLPDQTGQVNIANFPNEITAAKAQVAKAEAFLADLEAFVADATEADANFGKAVKKPGK